MPIDYSQCALPKGTPRKRVKGRKQRAERAVKQSVRAACVERDGRCRMSGEDCDGPSEWAHLAGYRRSQTRGMGPEERHDTRTSLMLCRRHHAMEERGELRVTFFTLDGCDGPLHISEVTR
jgi:hypothetical protein